MRMEGVTDDATTITTTADPRPRSQHDMNGQQSRRASCSGQRTDVAAPVLSPTSSRTLRWQLSFQCSRPCPVRADEVGLPVRSSRWPLPGRRPEPVAVMWLGHADLAQQRRVRCWEEHRRRCFQSHAAIPLGSWLALLLRSCQRLGTVLLLLAVLGFSQRPAACHTGAKAERGVAPGLCFRTRSRLRSLAAPCSGSMPARLTAPQDDTRGAWGCRGARLEGGGTATCLGA